MHFMPSGALPARRDFEEGPGQNPFTNFYHRNKFRLQNFTIATFANRRSIADLERAGRARARRFGGRPATLLDCPFEQRLRHCCLTSYSTCATVTA